MSITHSASQAIEHQQEIASLPFVQNRAVGETAQTLRDELLYHRATQTYLWALPLLNTLGMQRGSEKAFGEGYDILPIWKKRLDAQTLVTTPNSDVIYAMSYVDLGQDGPLVFEAAPMLQGILLDFWQRPIPVDGGKYAGDFGFFGPDQGQGGKFLLLPPGYDDEVPEGYFVCRSGTNNVFMFFRAFYADANNLQPPVDLLESTKIYPLKGAAKPMQFPDASDVPAANFWSVTLYEAENASGLANGQPFPSLGSRDHPVQNADGSTDLELGPEASPGKEKNWLAHRTGQRVLHHSAALRADRGGAHEDLEARRRRQSLKVDIPPVNTDS